MIAIDVIKNLQEAFKVREAAKQAYHKSRNPANAGAYSDSLLTWDLAWDELMNFKIDG